MKWTQLLTTERLLEWGGIGVMSLWAVYKKELQDAFKGGAKKLYAYLFRGSVAAEQMKQQQKAILNSGLTGLETLLLLLLKEYKADRATIVEYEERDGSHWATCVVEVRQADMQSIQQRWQQAQVDPSVWDEIQRIHNISGRWSYVPDARVLDIAPLRAALLDSGVWSAYYQSMPNSTGRQQGMLSLSWHNEHLLTDAQLAALHLSGSACATVFSLMAASKPTLTN